MSGLTAVLMVSFHAIVAILEEEEKRIARHQNPCYVFARVDFKLAGYVGSAEADQNAFWKFGFTAAQIKLMVSLFKLDE
jgi:hypothetical protein